MSIKKRVAMGFVTIGLVSSLVGGATFAYFNATVANTGNTFTAGTVKIGESHSLATKGNIQPGSTGIDRITVTNSDATLDSNVKMTVTINGNNDLADAVFITSATYNGVALDLDVNNDGVTTYGELAEQTIDLSTFGVDDPDKALVINWSFVDSGEEQNDLQGVNFTPVLDFEAKQL